MPMVCDAPSILPNRQMVEMKTFERVSKRIEQDHGFAPEIADQVLDATLGFLITCGQADQPLAPSEIVDLGWHTFLLYTPEYMGFCRKHVGHFVHHVPNDDLDRVNSSGGSYDTVRYMMERGISFNHLLWGVNTDECMCEGGAVCDARPDDGTPLIKLCGSEVGRGPGCRHIVMSADCKGGSADCDQGEGGSGSGWDGCKGQPK